MEIMLGALTKARSRFLKINPRHRAWILVGLVVLFAVVVRVRLREMPLERDEGEYAYAGQLMLQGIPPYKLAYNMKLPGTYAAYAAAMAVFGQSPSGIHLGLTLVNAASIVLTFLVGRKMLDDVAGVAAAATYAFMSLSPSVLGLQAHATHFVVLPALAGALVVLDAAESGRFRPLFASGLWFGLAFVMKQHGIFFGVFGWFYLMWTRARVQTEQHSWSKIRARSKPFDWRKYGIELATYASGLLIPYLFTCLVLFAAGVFPRFIFWTITYANQYVTVAPLGNGGELFRHAMNVVASPNLLLWLLAAFGGILMWSERRLRQNKYFLAGFFLCSAASISIGLYFREHYFILLLPALSLMAGVAISRGWHLLKSSQTAERFLAVPAAGLFVAGLVFSLILHGEIWFGASPTRASQLIYGTSLFPEAVNIGGYLKTNAPPNTSIAVLGSEPEIYFYARRHSATGYIYMYPLREAHEYARKMEAEMIHEIETARPEYIVFVNVDESWLPQAGSKSILPEWWTGFARSYYDLVRNVDILSELPGKAGSKPPGSGNVLVLKRKPTGP